MVPFLSVNAEVLPHVPPKKSLPFQGRWLGEAETERSCQICDNLSVSLAADSSPERGAFSAAAGSPLRPFGPAPLDKGSLGCGRKKASPSRGGGSAKPRRRGCCKFAMTSQSACGCQLPYRVTASAALRRIRRRSCSPAARGWRAPWTGRARARGAWAGGRGRRPGAGIPRRSHTAPFCRLTGRAG